MILGLGPATPVYRFSRIRFADELPMALEYTTVPSFSLPSKEAVAERRSTPGCWCADGHRPVTGPCNACGRCCSATNRRGCSLCLMVRPAD